MAKLRTDYTWEEVGHTGSANGIIYKSQEERQTQADWWNANNQKRNEQAPILKLEKIKEVRLKKLQETDYYDLADTIVMPDNIREWRQRLRDIPQDYTTEEQYDELLAKDRESDWELNHEIWTKP